MALYLGIYVFWDTSDETFVCGSEVYNPKGKGDNAQNVVEIPASDCNRSEEPFIVLSLLEWDLSDEIDDISDNTLDGRFWEACNPVNEWRTCLGLETWDGCTCS